MTTVNMLEAKTRLSQLVEAVESGAEEEIVIARNGKPAAKLVRLDARRTEGRRPLGLAKGLFEAPADPYAQDDEILKLFGLDEE